MQVDGDVDNVSYANAFISAQAPAELRFICTQNNVSTPDPSDGLVYCDLGCGTGLTLNALACALPQAQLYGVDAHPDHIAAARAAAQSAGLSNVHYLERDFRALKGSQLPDCDIMVLHGVYTRVSDAVRRAIVALIGRHLKPGGLLLVGYNAMPGWSAMEPVRRMMHAMTVRMEGSVLDKVERARDYLRFMLERGTRTLTHSVVTRQTVSELLLSNPWHVAHEYFGENWRPMYFGEMEADLATVDLHFVGSHPAVDNDDEFAVPASLRASFEDIRSRGVREMQLDFVRFETFRQDVFVRGQPNPLGGTETDRLADLPFGTVRPRVEMPRAFTFRSGVTRFEAPIYTVLADLLSGRSGSARQLRSEDAELARFGLDEVVQAVKHLAFAGHAVPFLRSSEHLEPYSLGRFRVVAPFNRLKVENARREGRHATVASQVMGNGFRLTQEECRLLEGLEAVGAPGLLAWAAEHLADEPRPTAEGAPEQTGDASGASLAERAQWFLTQRVPQLLQLGVIEAFTEVEPPRT